MKLAAVVVGRALAAAALALSSLACGGDDATEPRPAAHHPGTTACAAGERLVDGKGCLAAGVQDDGCPAGTLGLEDGTCRAAGIPPDRCGDGFEADDRGGCAALLPARACAKGTMAIPGESECREVAPCGQGPWGEIPVEADTQFVDGSYAGADSDGSADKPWTTVGEAVAAADSGAIVAVAAGSYAEDVVIAKKHVRVWGVCPKLAEIAGSGAKIAALQVVNGGSGTEVHDIALRGPESGFALSGSDEVVLDRVWVHASGSRGVDIEAVIGPTSFVLRRSLVEQNIDVGVFVDGAAGEIHETVIRDTFPQASDGKFGEGVEIIDGAKVTIERTLVERSRETGVLAIGAEATLLSTVVRDTKAAQSSKEFGWGIGVLVDPKTGVRAKATVQRSVVERNTDDGVFIEGTDAVIEETVVRDTLPRATDQQFGRGIEIQATTSGVRAEAEVRASLIEANRDAGLYVNASDAIVEGVVVRETQPRGSDGTAGVGIAFEADPVSLGRTSATVRASVVEGNHVVGIAVTGADAIIEGTAVRATQPQASDSVYGRGITVQIDYAIQAAGNGTVRTSLVEGNLEIGIEVTGASGTIESTAVLGTGAALDGTYGDAILVNAGQVGAAATIGHCVGAGSARAGVSSFGASVGIEATWLDCNAFDLDGETPFPEYPFSFDDLGGNECGCGEEAVACKAVSSSLQPPVPLPSLNET